MSRMNCISAQDAPSACKKQILTEACPIWTGLGIHVLTKPNMASISTSARPEVSPSSTAGGQTYRRPFAIMTLLFFMWGFVNVLNDILIPRFKEAFTLNYFEAMLVQLAFFGAYSIGGLVYYLISMLYGDPINRIGYKKGVIIGLLISAFGSALFYPAAMMTRSEERRVGKECSPRPLP